MRRAQLARSFLFAFGVSTGAPVLGACAVQARGAVVVDSPPPPPRRVHVEPRPGLHWVDGMWASRGGRWVWLEGGWIRDRPGHVHVQGRWTRRGGRWHWVEPRWERRAPHRVRRDLEVRDHRSRSKVRRRGQRDQRRE